MTSDAKLTRCGIHGIMFTAEAEGCPLCVEEEELAALRDVPPTPKRRTGTKGKLTQYCPFCQSRSIRAARCSRYACRLKAQRRTRKLTKTCVHCGGKTKYVPACTKYPCRQKSKRVGMYQPRRVYT